MKPVPTVTAAEMREVDRIMVEDLGISLVQMMENAGRHLADLALILKSPAKLVVLAGPGGNGGGGMVAARHLANRDVDVSVVLVRDELSPVTGHQRSILRAMGVPVDRWDPNTAMPEGDLVIDAVIGYSLSGAPRGPAKHLIDWIEVQQAPVLSLDTPSGLDVTTGAPSSPCVTANATMTLALPKAGFASAGAQRFIGDLYAADISVPPAVYREALGKDPDGLFRTGTVVRIDPRELGIE